MNVIVFGGTGWVGHNIVREFHAAGHGVTVCSRGRKTNYESCMPEGVGRICADKTKPADIKEVFEKRYNAVIDTVPTIESIDNIVKHAGNIKHYIHCSSTGGYAPLPYVPADETCAYDHFMGGWKHKAAVDSSVMALFKRKGFPATVIRPCYITGPGMLPLDNLGGRRADFISDIIAGRTLDLPNDGQALLQPVHVAELARAFLLAVQAPGSIGQIYNICLEKAVTIRRYMEITASSLGREEKLRMLPVEEMLLKHAGSVNEVGLRFFATHMCYDIRKAREQLGFVPHFTTEEAIEETARWAADLI